MPLIPLPVPRTVPIDVADDGGRVANVEADRRKLLRKDPRIRAAFRLNLFALATALFSALLQLVTTGGSPFSLLAILMTVVSILVLLIMVPTLIGLMNAMRRKFREGTLHPALVVTTHPPILAVYADLSRRRTAETPAIKLVEQILDESDIPNMAPGSRTTAVCYFAGESEDTESPWRNVYPTAVAYGLDDRAELERLERLITEAEWERLEHFAAGLSNPTLGLHILWTRPRADEAS